jgi:hypothetical protein
MYRIILFSLGLFVTTIFYLSFQPGKIVASGNCLPLFNGGITSKQYCQNPTPTLAENTSSTTTGQFPSQQSGSGQKVYPSTNSKATPNTGPENWSLFALFFLGGTGLLLINKAKAA